MSNDDKRDRTGPHQPGSGVDLPELRIDLDPIAIATGLVSDDPSVGELVAFGNAVTTLRDRTPNTVSERHRLPRFGPAVTPDYSADPTSVKLHDCL